MKKLMTIEFFDDGDEIDTPLLVSTNCPNATITPSPNNERAKRIVADLTKNGFVKLDFMHQVRGSIAAALDEVAKEGEQYKSDAEKWRDQEATDRVFGSITVIKNHYQDLLKASAELSAIRRACEGVESAEVVCDRIIHSYEATGIITRDREAVAAKARGENTNQCRVCYCVVKKGLEIGEILSPVCEECFDDLTKFFANASREAMAPLTPEMFGEGEKTFGNLMCGTGGSTFKDAADKLLAKRIAAINAKHDENRSTYRLATIEDFCCDENKEVLMSISGRLFRGDVFVKEKD